MRIVGQTPRSILRHAIAGSLALLGCFGVAERAGAQAEVFLEIRKSDHFAIPVVVEDFGYDELAATGRTPHSGSATAEEIVARDLTLSDAVAVIRLPREAPLPSGLLFDVRGNPVRSNVQARLRAEIAPAARGLQLAAALLDEATGKTIFDREYPLAVEAGGETDPWGLHRLSDDVVLFLTGSRGCAATRLSFVRSTPQGKELFLIDWDGSHEQQLTRLGAIVVSPAWNPTAQRIACTSYHAGWPELVSIEMGSGALSQLSSDRMPSAPAYSPDGKEIAFSTSRDGNAEIYIAAADGSRPRRLTVNQSIDTSPTWSPSGTRLAFTSDRTGQPQIFVVDRDGGNLEQLTFSGEWNDSPDWSPGADRIVHVSRCDEGFELALINADGSNWQRLTVGGGCENPHWAADGRHIVFARSVGGLRNLWVLGVDSGTLRQLTASEYDSYNPAWSKPSKERPGAAYQGG